LIRTPSILKPQISKSLKTQRHKGKFTFKLLLVRVETRVSNQGIKYFSNFTRVFQKKREFEGRALKMSSQQNRPENTTSVGGLQLGKGEPVVASGTPPAPVEKQQQHQVQSHHSTPKQNVSPNIIGSHYKVGKKIGEGSFGIIYEGVSLINHAPCAIKFEPRKSDAPQLRDEFRTYKVMQGCGMRPVLTRVLFSRNPECLLFWPRRSTQHPLHRPTRS
jgi:hypothetical protein